MGWSGLWKQWVIAVTAAQQPGTIFMKSLISSPEIIENTKHFQKLPPFPAYRYLVRLNILDIDGLQHKGICHYGPKQNENQICKIIEIAIF
jgi:hypothetical protein